MKEYGSPDETRGIENDGGGTVEPEEWGESREIRGKEKREKSENVGTGLRLDSKPKSILFSREAHCTSWRSGLKVIIT